MASTPLHSVRCAAPDISKTVSRLSKDHEPMIIEEIRSRAVSVPLEIPIVSAIRQSERVELVVVDVVTSAGIVGQSYLQAFGVQPARAIQAMLSYLGDALRGENALLTLRCHQI